MIIGKGGDNVLEKMLTLKEVAEYLNVSENTVRRWSKMRQIPAIKIGRQWRYRKTDIDRWVREQAVDDSDL